MLGLNSAQQRKNQPLSLSLTVLTAEQSSGALNTTKEAGQEMGQGLSLSISPPGCHLYFGCPPVKAAITGMPVYGGHVCPPSRCVDSGEWAVEP